MWSASQHVAGHNVNSYKLETLDGARLAGEYSARRLQEFIPREGTELAEAQKVFMERMKAGEAERRQKETEEVAELRMTEREGIERLALDMRGACTDTRNMVQLDLFDQEKEVQEVQEVQEVEGEGIAHRVRDRR
jgi:hypothetical protein